MIGGPVDIIIEYGDGSSPTNLVNITQHVLEFNGIAIEQLIEMVRSYGVAWDKNLPIGVGKMDDIELGGLLDDAVNGPDDLFDGQVPIGPNTLPRLFKVTWFGTKTTQLSTVLKRFERPPDLNGITKYKAILTPTGAPTET